MPNTASVSLGVISHQTNEFATSPCFVTHNRRGDCVHRSIQL